MRDSRLDLKESVCTVGNTNVFVVDTKGNKNVTSLAVLVDDAASKKDCVLPYKKEEFVSVGHVKKVLMLNRALSYKEEGVSDKKTPARIWVDLLQREIAQIALDHNKELPEVVYEATKAATEKFPQITEDEKLNFQAPAASVLVSRINNGIFETFSTGNNGMIVHYQDGTVETYAGNEDSQREAMPCLGDADKMRKFMLVKRILRDKRKNLTTHANDAMWSLATRVEMVKSVALFSADVKPAFMDDEIAKEFVARSDKNQTMKMVKMLDTLYALGAFLKINQYEEAVGRADAGKLKKVAFNDRMALLFDLVDERE